MWTNGSIYLVYFPLFGCIYIYDNTDTSVWYEWVCGNFFFYDNSFNEVGYSCIEKYGIPLPYHVTFIVYKYSKDSKRKYIEGIWFLYSLFYSHQEMCLTIIRVCFWHVDVVYINNLWLFDNFWCEYTTICTIALIFCSFYFQFCNTINFNKCCIKFFMNLTWI